MDFAAGLALAATAWVVALGAVTAAVGLGLEVTVDVELVHPAIEIINRTRTRTLSSGMKERFSFFMLITNK
ncbi:MAG: hypothetical protein ACXV2D_08120 [Halobacteriota archaeon]